MELRAYYFGNMYLSSIQQGIQAAHVTAEMFTKFPTQVGDRAKMLHSWANDHKTMILLNAGYGSEIRELMKMFVDAANPFPYAAFWESEEALDGALTSIGIILPEYIWTGSKQIREDGFEALRYIRENGRIEWSPGGDTSKPLVRTDISKWEFELICRLNNYGLAK
jgi:hypothetical protein